MTEGVLDGKCPYKLSACTFSVPYKRELICQSTKYNTLCLHPEDIYKRGTLKGFLMFENLSGL